MTSKGWSHISLGTLDMNATRAFYEGVLGFKAVRCDVIKVKEGGEIRHVFFDTGQKQLLAFMEPRGVPGAPVEFDGGLNRPLGMPEGVYHFAFEAGSQVELEQTARPTRTPPRTIRRPSPPRTTSRATSHSGTASRSKPSAG